MVTANRTESFASKTPIALTAVTGQSLKAEGVTNPLASSFPSRNNGTADFGDPRTYGVRFGAMF